MSDDRHAELDAAATLAYATGYKAGVRDERERAQAELRLLQRAMADELREAIANIKRQRDHLDCAMRELDGVSVDDDELDAWRAGGPQ